jgi:hypothetical protein
MPVELRVVVHLDEADLLVLRDIRERLIRIERKEGEIMAKVLTLDDILARIQSQGTVEDSIKVLVDSLVAAKNDPAKLAAIVSALDGNDAKLAAAILSGTPAAPSGPTVIPASVSVSNGSSVQLSVDDANGTDITASASYSSDDDTTASVTPQGLVTGNKIGTATVTVTDANGNATKVPVTVS